MKAKLAILISATLFLSVIIGLSLYFGLKTGDDYSSFNLNSKSSDHQKTESSSNSEKNSSTSSTIPLLFPGNGFLDKSPKSTGTPLPIARFNAVPFQSFDREFHLGVLAFHKDGIQEVSFQANGGESVKVQNLKMNPRTQTPEYFILCAPEFFKQDQAVEIRATVTSTQGQKRHLDPIFLYPIVNKKKNEIFVSFRSSRNGQGTRFSPFNNFKDAFNAVDDGGKIILVDSGIYPIELDSKIPKNNQQWITIEPLEFKKHPIILKPKKRATFRQRSKRIKWHNIAFDFGFISQYYLKKDQYVWFSQCKFFDSNGWKAKYKGQSTPVRLNQFIGGSYATDSQAEDMLHGFDHFNLVRNCHVEKISGDVFTNNHLTVNCTVQQVDGGLLDHHSDLHQYFGHWDNIIVYNIQSFGIRKTQNFFLDHQKSSFKNMAFVNIAIENFNSNPPVTQFSSDNSHILFYHVSNPGQRLLFREDHKGSKKFTGRDFIFKNCVFENMLRTPTLPGLPEGVEVIDCHFTEGKGHGHDPTTGSLKLKKIGVNQFEYSEGSESWIQHNALAIPGVYYPNIPQSGKVNRGAILQ